MITLEEAKKEIEELRTKGAKVNNAHDETEQKQSEAENKLVELNDTLSHLLVQQALGEEAINIPQTKKEISSLEDKMSDYSLTLDGLAAMGAEIDERLYSLKRAMRPILNEKEYERLKKEIKQKCENELLTDENLEADFMRIAYNLGRGDDAYFYLRDIHDRVDTLQFNKRHPAPTMEKPKQV